MAINICVSTSEWVVVNKRNSSGEENILVTSGLSGCVAVAVESETQICLMHVLSSLLAKSTTPEENKNVLRDIELPLVVMGDRGGSRPRRFTLVYNGGTDKPRAEAIETHLLTRFPALKGGRHLVSNGLRVRNAEAGEKEYVTTAVDLPKGYDWKECTGAMQGLAESKGVCIETWGKIGTEWVGNWERE